MELQMAGKPTIVFVDDETSVLNALKRSMRHFSDDMELYFYSNPKAALDFVLKKNPDVLVSDICMPGLDGLALVTKVREQELDTKIIMLTGTADLSGALTAINAANVYRFYTKPCKPSVLAEGITAALRGKRVKAENEGYRKSSFKDAIGTAALNHISIAVIIVDAQRKIVFSNRAGGELLATNDSLIWSNNDVCRATKSAETEKLHAMIENAISTSFEALDDSVISLSRLSDRRPLNVVVGTLDNISDENFAILFITDPDKICTPSPDIIGKLFDLTPAEARLTHAIASGEKMADAAETCGITPSTARTYLKQVFQKTQIGRQSDLVKLVLTSAVAM
jgi:DNA-binding NarL/FixJ family response regulator